MGASCVLQSLLEHMAWNRKGLQCVLFGCVGSLAQRSGGWVGRDSNNVCQTVSEVVHGCSVVPGMNGGYFVGDWGRCFVGFD